MKIVFGSDLIMRNYPEYIGDDAVEYMFGDMKPVFDDADFRMMNLEAIFNRDFEPIIKSGPAHFALPEFVHVLRFLNIDLVGAANNHTGDYGEDGVFYTMDILQKNRIPFVGMGKNLDEAYNAHVFEKDGETVSVFAVCENEFGTADTDFAGSAGYRLGLTAKKIREEKEKSDYVVVYFHGGNEDNPFPSPGKQELYRFFIDLGADAVVAMHTHCPQGYEYYNGKPIVYSMGNFFFPYPKSGGAYDSPNSTFRFGYLTGLTFKNGSVQMEIYPYHFMNDKVERLVGDKLDKFNQYMEVLCAPLGDEAEMRRWFEGWCMIGGRIYVQHAKWDEEMRTDRIKIKNMRNAFTCEAHNEVIREYLKLCYAGREEAAMPYKEKIEALFKINIYEE